MKIGDEVISAHYVVPEDASDEEILEGYAAEIDAALTAVAVNADAGPPYLSPKQRHNVRELLRRARDRPPNVTEATVRGASEAVSDARQTPADSK